MKRLALTLVCFAIVGAVKAQFCATHEGTSLCYEIDNKVVNRIFKDTLYINKVYSENGNLIIKEGSPKVDTQTSSFIQIDPNNRTYYYGKDGITRVSMMNAEEGKNLIDEIYNQSYKKADPQRKVEVQANFERVKKNFKCKGDAYIALNPNAAAGDKLPKTEYVQKIKMIKSGTSIDKGIVEGRETLTTPAGTFKCIKVSYRAKIKMFLFSETTYVTEWYAENIGLVKSIEMDKNKKTCSIKTLVSINSHKK